MDHSQDGLWYEEELAYHTALVMALNKETFPMDVPLVKHSSPPVGRDMQLSPNNIELSKQQYDDIVLDGSASMQGLWWDMLSAIDGYVDQLKLDQLDTHIRLSIFTTGEPENLDLVARNCRIAHWVPLLDDPVGAHFFSTPLYDAINLTGRRLRALDPARAAITFVTDGGENGSQFTDLTQAKSIIDWMKAKGWQVTFIGCDFNNQDLARRLGITPAAAIGVHRAHIGDAIRTLADKRALHGKTGQPIHWTDDEKTEFGGYLNAPSASAK